MQRESHTAAHWDSAYGAGETMCSWSQQDPRMSVRMLDAAGVTVGDSVIDVGGGTSKLAAALLERGFRDVTVLDISTVAIKLAQQRLGAQAGNVCWLTADILTWEPCHRYRVWHDRALFHFLATASGRRRYLHALDAATGPGAIAVFGCSAPDGPQQCSGLRVARYAPGQLARQLGNRWTLIACDREVHVTPQKRDPAVYLGRPAETALIGSAGKARIPPARRRVIEQAIPVHRYPRKLALAARTQQGGQRETGSGTGARTSSASSGQPSARRSPP